MNELKAELILGAITLIIAGIASWGFSTWVPLAIWAAIFLGIVFLSIGDFDL